MKKHIIYIDGATHIVNPSTKIGYAAMFDDDFELGIQTSEHKILTNNMAEYNGLLLALKMIEERNPTLPMIIYSDSSMLVNQMTNGMTIGKGAYRSLALIAKDKLMTLKQKYKISIFWIPRKKNTKADLLSKQAMNEEK